MRGIIWVVILCSSCASSQHGAESPASNEAESKPRAAPAAQIQYAGGDGSSCAKAIRILGAPTEEVGVKAEYDWLAENRPGYSTLAQSLIQCSESPADRLVIAMPDGTEQEIIFDISEFFGKF